MGVLGTPLLRLDALGKATGATCYSQDIFRRGALHGVVVRSSIPAGRLVEIDTSSAEQVQGVACVLTAADLPDRRWGIMKPDEGILARDVVRYIGEPIALVAAESATAAVEAASEIRARIEASAPVVRLEDAIAPNAVEVHKGESNLMDTATVRRGDVEGSFQRASLIVATRLESHRVHQGYIEPRVALAELDGDRLLVTMSSQAPFGVRVALSRLLDLPLSRIGVKVPAVGGGFGGKLHPGMAPFASALCLATGRPVQVVCSRDEEMEASNPRENSIIEVESAVDDGGTHSCTPGNCLPRRRRVCIRHTGAHFARSAAGDESLCDRGS